MGNMLSTVYKKHANLKFLIGRAIKKKKMTENPYKYFPIKRNIKSSNEDVLEEYEIKKLQKAYDKNVYSNGKRDVLRCFLFSCYTGLSYAEFNTVCYSDIKTIRMPSGDFYHILTNERTKSDVIYKIPIVSPVVLKLLGDGSGIRKIFRILTNQPTNRYVKEIMKDVNIHKKMTFHRARHRIMSFAL